RELTFIWRKMRCRRSRADISADAEISASRLAGDAELLHLRLQRRAFHTQAGGRTGGTADGASTRHEKVACPHFDPPHPEKAQREPRKRVAARLLSPLQ